MFELRNNDCEDKVIEAEDERHSWSDVGVAEDHLWTTTNTIIVSVTKFLLPLAKISSSKMCFLASISITVTTVLFSPYSQTSAERQAYYYPTSIKFSPHSFLYIPPAQSKFSLLSPVCSPLLCHGHPPSSPSLPESPESWQKIATSLCLLPVARVSLVSYTTRPVEFPWNLYCAETLWQSGEKIHCFPYEKHEALVKI